jgi:hypothetical protein
MHAGHDEAFIERSMPALTVTLPLISANCVQVAQDGTSEIVGVVLVTPTALQGIALLYGLFVDPAHWKRGIRHSSRLAKRPAVTTMSKSVKRLRRRASR